MAMDKDTRWREEAGSGAAVTGGCGLGSNWRQAMLLLGQRHGTGRSSIMSVNKRLCAECSPFGYVLSMAGQAGAYGLVN